MPYKQNDRRTVEELAYRLAAALIQIHIQSYIDETGLIPSAVEALWKAIGEIAAKKAEV
jgi:hypothetical protein